MSTAPESPQPSAPAQVPTDGLTKLARRPETFGYSLLALGLVLALVATGFGMRGVRNSDALPADEARAAAVASRKSDMRVDYLLICFWSSSLALVSFVTGIVRLVQRSRPEDVRLEQERDLSRLLVMSLGALSGVLTTFFVGIGLGLAWWDVIAGGWAVWQGPQGWKLWVILAGFFGGLVLTFFSLQLARANERSSQTQRQLLYSFNAVFTGLLLIAILIGLNFLMYTSWGPFAILGKEYSWAGQNIYELSPESDGILKAIKKPTKFFVIVTNNDPLYFALVALMDNCKAVVNDDKMFEVEFLSPDRDRERVGALGDDYKFEERKGVLILYGDGPVKDSTFVKYDDLMAQRDRQRPQLYFRGEQILMTELGLLESGKTQPTLYFLQGNGEMSLNESRSGNFRESCSLIRRVLENYHYRVKGLQLAPASGESKDPNVLILPRVPEDASVVIIAGPRHALAGYTIKALSEYMDKRGGKMIVFFDVVKDPKENKMAQTGLEKFLDNYNVAVGDGRILRFVDNLRNEPTSMLARPPKGQANAPGLVAQLLRSLSSSPIVLVNARTVQASKKPPGGANAKFFPEVLLEAPAEQIIWEEKDLVTDARTLVGRQDKNKLMAEKRSLNPLPVAVVISEMPEGNPHAPMQSDAKPRLAVFGCSYILCDDFTRDPGAQQMTGDLFRSVLGWMRERPVSGPSPKGSDTFMLRPDAPIFKIILLPGLLAFVGIVGLGLGVWVVRRT